MRLRHAPLVLAPLGSRGPLVALARPRTARARGVLTTQGVDIVVALDVSGSMAAEDFQPKNRFEVAKDCVRGVHRAAQERPPRSRRLRGPHATKSPPTTDSAMLLRPARRRQARHDQADGTAIGSGLATSLTRLRRSKAKSRVVVLVTDGSNNAGEIDPDDRGGHGEGDGRPRLHDPGRPRRPRPDAGPGAGPVHGRRAQAPDPREVQVDEALLKRIATATGGEFFRATDSQSPRGSSSTASTAREVARSRRALHAATASSSRSWPRPAAALSRRCSRSRGPRACSRGAAMIVSKRPSWLFGLARRCRSPASRRSASRRASAAQRLAPRARAALVSPGRGQGALGAAARLHALRPPRLLAVVVALALVRRARAAALGRRARESRARGQADVVLVLDTSGSMAPPDVSPPPLLPRASGALSLIAASRATASRSWRSRARRTRSSRSRSTRRASVSSSDASSPGSCAKPGTSLGAGLATAAELFVDRTAAAGHRPLLGRRGPRGRRRSGDGRAKAEGITSTPCSWAPASGHGRTRARAGRRGPHERLQVGRERTARPVEARSGPRCAGSRPRREDRSRPSPP